MHPLPPPLDSAAPGWYVDPIASDMLRWWDGSEWSETEFKLVKTAMTLDLLRDGSLSPIGRRGSLLNVLGCTAILGLGIVLALTVDPRGWAIVGGVGVLDAIFIVVAVVAHRFDIRLGSDPARSHRADRVGAADAGPRPIEWQQQKSTVSDQDQLQPLQPTSVEQRASNFAVVAWRLLPAHVFLTGLITYVVIAACTVIGGAYTEGLQVISFAFYSAQLTILVFVIGLPLRIASSMRRWWFRHAAWSLALFGLAGVGILLSFFVGDAGPVHYTETAEWPSTDGYGPDTRVFLPSLLVLAFAAMHLLPPLRRWRTQEPVHA